MSKERHTWSSVGLQQLCSLIPRPPRIATCIVVYYALLIALGVFADSEDPLNGILNVLFLTHLFAVASAGAHGAPGVLIMALVPVGIALSAVWLSGWWRIVAVMGLIISVNVFGVYSAAKFDGWRASLHDSRSTHLAHSYGLSLSRT